MFAGNFVFALSVEGLAVSHAVRKDSGTVKLDGDITRVQVLRQFECCLYTSQAETLAHLMVSSCFRPICSVGT